MSDAAALPLTVLIVDDHFVVRSGLAASLELDDTIRIVGEAERSEEVVAAYRQHRPRVVLLDLQLPGQGGIAAMAALRAHDANARVLIFSTFARDDEIQAALDAGALGFLQNLRRARSCSRRCAAWRRAGATFRRRSPAGSTPCGSAPRSRRANARSSP